MRDNTKLLKLIALIADGKFHSGDELGKILNLSRVSVHHYIGMLSRWGIDVAAVRGRGYYLPEPLQLLDQQRLSESLKDNTIFLEPVIHSTNQFLLERQEKLNSGAVCVAEYQSAGRGRRGNRWFSPFGRNIYYSMFWRSGLGIPALAGLSLVVGLVTAQTLHEFGEPNVKVKWPNDLFLNDKKLAGILVEVSGKIGETVQIILGIGINVGMKSVDETVTQDWANLAHCQIDRNALIIRLTENLIAALQHFEEEGFAPFLDHWLALDNFLGRRIILKQNDDISLSGIARGIDAQGGLLLEVNGETRVFFSGEVSTLRADKC